MYIFGYGSLINGHSRQLTGQTGEALPAIVTGLQRRWGKVNDSYRIAPLVAEVGEGCCNGVLVKIHPEVLADFDRREKGYRRIELDPENISLGGSCFGSDPVWAYVKANSEPPCEIQPIMQSYVDTVLAGCLSISGQFAKTFVETTLGWHYPMENDRHQPKYSNLAGVDDEHLVFIDRLLADARARSGMK